MTDRDSKDLHRLTALTWDASIPIAFTVDVPGVPQTGYFLVPKMISVHLCSKPMFEQLVQVDAGFGTDKFKGWFEYKARFNKNHFTAVIPWSVPVGVVVDWLIALEFPNEVRTGTKDPIDKLFEDNALPLELKWISADQKATDDVPVEAILQSNFIHVDKQFAHKLWMSSLLGSASEAVKLPPQIERSLRSWDPHTFFRGRREMAKKAGDQMKNALIAFHIVQPVTAENRAKSYATNSSPPTTQNHISLNTTLRLVEIGTEKMSTFGQLLKQNIFSQYQKLSNDQCLSTEPLSSDLGLVRVLGMNPPLYTPLQFLRDNLSGRDFCLHVVVRPLANTCVATASTTSGAVPIGGRINSDDTSGVYGSSHSLNPNSMSNMSNSSLLLGNPSNVTAASVTGANNNNNKEDSESPTRTAPDVVVAPLPATATVKSKIVLEDTPKNDDSSSGGGAGGPDSKSKNSSSNQQAATNTNGGAEEKLTVDPSL